MTLSLIDPSKLPGFSKGVLQLDADAVSTHASTLSGLGSTITEHGASTLRAWQKLPASYQSDGAEHLYDVMTPVGTATTTIGDGIGAVATALSAYAEEVRPIQASLLSLKSRADAFVSSAKNYKPHEQSTTDVWVKISAGPMGFIDPPKVTIDSWDQDQKMVDQNNSLIREGMQLAEQWLQAQTTCANAILAASGQTVPTNSGQQTPDQIMAAAEQQLPWGDKNISTPWGSTGDREESCGEKTLGFPAHFVGGVFEGAFGMVKGVGSLLSGWDGTGIPWSAELAAGWITGRSDMVSDAWKRAGQGYAGAWLGMAHLVSGLSLPGQIVDGIALSPVGNMLPSEIRKPLQDWAHSDGTAVMDTVGGLVGLKVPDQWWDAKSWDGFNIAQAWVDNPGGATGESAFNIASFFVPGGGEASAAGHAGEAAGDVARLGTDGLADAGRAGAHGADAFVDASKGVTEGDLAGLSKGVDASDFSGVDHLDFQPSDIPKIDDIHIPDDVSGMQHEWGGTDAPVEHVPAPVHEPALVGADGAADAAHGPKSELNAPGDGAAGDAPRPPADSPTGGSGSSHSGSDAGSSGGSHGGSGDGGSGSGSSGHGGGGDHGAGDSSAPGDHSGSSDPAAADPATPATPATPAHAEPTQYVDATGKTHDIIGSPSTLEHAATSQAAIESAVASHGSTMAEFNHLVHDVPIHDLTREQAQLISDVRHSVPEPVTGEVMQKVLDPETVKNLFSDDPKVSYNDPDSKYFDGRDYLGGFVSKASDALPLHTPTDIYHGLGLDYSGTKFHLDDGATYSVRFEMQSDMKLEIPDGELASQYGRDGYVDHLVSEGDPFHGNGFAGTGEKTLLPEYVVTDGRVAPPGSEMWATMKDGSQQLVAVLDDAKHWVPVVVK